MGKSSERLAPAPLHVWSGILPDPLHHALVAQGPYIGRSHGCTCRMAGIGKPVVEIPAGLDHLRHFIAHHHAADRQIPRRQALGHGKEIRPDAVQLVPEPLPRAAETADHLVGHQQYVMTAADALDFRPVAGWRNDDATGPLDRLPHKGRHPVGSGFEDFFLDPARSPQAERLFCFTVQTMLQEPRLLDVHDIGHRQVTLRMHCRHAPQTRTTEGRAVVTVPAPDQHLLLRLPLQGPVMAHHAHHGVDRLRAGIGIEHMTEAGRRYLGHQGRQLGHPRMGGLEESVVVRQLAQLCIRRLGQVTPAIAQVDAPQPGHAVDQAHTVRIPDMNALPPDHHPAALPVQCLHVGKGMQMMGGIQLAVMLGTARIGSHDRKLRTKT